MPMDMEGDEYDDEEGEEQTERAFMTDSLFGLVGDHGNNLMVYETDSIVLRHKINVGQVIRSFKFTENLREVFIITKD